MAALVLQAAGSVAGSFLAGPLGALFGQAVGAAGGALIDRALFGGGAAAKNVTGPRLKSLDGVTSTEGDAVPRVYGRARIGGQMIWATRFEETATRQRSGTSGGKGGAKAGSTTTYTYFANFAVGLCEGPIAFVRRVWADGKELDLTTVTMRVYHGAEDQQPDALILAKQGAAGAPAYRGLAYVVFEHLALAGFGNRVPQLAFEVVRPVGGLASMVRAVDLIPGATEFGYGVNAVTQTLGQGVSTPENRHQLARYSDWTASLDALQALCPNLVSVALIVAWFGDDLRAGSCTIAPRVENQTKITDGDPWVVAGVTRDTARVVSQVDGSPAYGGTPSDPVVAAAIYDLRQRGLAVTFYPFVMMDVAAGNALPDPATGLAPQPAYPWRGRITCDPAPGRPGTADATAAAATQVAAFFGSAAPGAGEFSFRRFILHCADLCLTAGGVDAFLIGSELVGLTRVRSAPGVYPAAAALASLAADIKARLPGGTKVSYAADWTEYGAHVIGGGAEINFPLDVVWGSPAVDFVGIDVYWPVSDWRDGAAHLDAQEALSVYDRAYLARKMAPGEDFDWYYASPADRAAQVRTPITDGAYNKPWIYRVKDLIGWWSNAHVARAGGVETTASAWTPKSKPIWFTELGCPAIDRGANSPNLFIDPKSSDSGIPPFSRGRRDDLMQTRMIEAALTRFDPFQPGYVAGSNPLSPLYGGFMVEPTRIHIWCWDARPFPAFPVHSEIWADAANWQTGHWLTGRVEGVALDRLVAAILSEAGVDTLGFQLPALDGFLEGYVLDTVMSPRGALEPLGALFGFDAVVAAGAVRFAGRGGRSVAVLADDDLVPDKSGRLIELTRAQESELPHELSLTFSDADNDYRKAASSSRRLAGAAKRASHAALAAVLRRPEAQRLADIWLQDLWVARETARFTLRPNRLDLEIGDAVTLSVAGAPRLFRIQSIRDGAAREVSARAVEPAVYDAPAPVLKPQALPAPRFAGPPRVLFLDLATDRDAPSTLQYLAVFSDPWPGAVAVWRQLGDATYEFLRTIARPALIGDTLSAFSPGVAGRIDYASSLTLRLSSGALASVSDAELFAGKTAMALRGADGAWEIFGFGRAELIADKTYRLSRLLRGLGGEEGLAQRTVAAGAPVVLLDDGVIPIASGLSALGAVSRYRIGPADRDYASSAYIEVVGAVTPKALMPFAPVRAAAARGVSGVTVTFTRRSRIDADNWEPLDIGLGEQSEAYDIEIWQGPLRKRVIGAVTPQCLYASADELADFGAAQSALLLVLYQKSAAVGRGFPLVVSVAVM